MRPLADERSIRPDPRPAGTRSLVEANAQRLKQVLLNLVSNAIKYSPPSTEVTVAVRRAGTCAPRST